MKERPILFSAPMVRAILNGSKTQTRRVLRHQPELREVPGTFGGRLPMIRKQRGGGYWIMPNAMPFLLAECPYGVAGDRLWVRETWGFDFAAVHAKQDTDGPFVYRVDGDNKDRTLDGRWRPSIHMLRAASRITLKITDVRVQRLQEITWPDALAEGVRAWEESLAEDQSCIVNLHDPRDVFAELWESINYKRAPWNSNPWVWALTFERAA